MTFFMIPLMVVEGRSIRESMKEGKEMMMRTFGTNIASGAWNPSNWYVFRSISRNFCYRNWIYITNVAGI